MRDDAGGVRTPSTLALVESEITSNIQLVSARTAEGRDEERTRVIIESRIFSAVYTVELLAGKS